MGIIVVPTYRYIISVYIDRDTYIKDIIYTNQKINKKGTVYSFVHLYYMHII